MPCGSNSSLLQRDEDDDDAVAVVRSGMSTPQRRFSNTFAGAVPAVPETAAEAVAEVSNFCLVRFTVPGCHGTSPDKPSEMAAKAQELLLLVRDVDVGVSVDVRVVLLELVLAL